MNDDLVYSLLGYRGEEKFVAAQRPSHNASERYSSVIVDMFEILKCNKILVTATS